MTASPTYDAFADAARRRRPRVALILGSGLGHLADRLCDVEALPFDRVPGLEAPSIPGHRGAVLVGDWAGRAVLLFSGRLHYYEGHPWSRVERPAEIAHALGAEVLLVTNAAGGIRPDLRPGDLMAIDGHVEWTRPDCWRHRAVARPYAPELVERLRQAAARLGFALPVGVYAQVTGPSYETPAEIGALRAWGADAVGMSTAREVSAAAALGLRCAAVSCITNAAAGLSGAPINHEEVLATAAARRDRLAALVQGFLGGA